MTASWVGSDAQGNNALSTSVTIPATAQSGDIAIVVHPYNHGQAPGDSSISSAGGAWTQLRSTDWSASYRARVYYRILTAGEDSDVVTLTQPAGGSQKLSAALGTIRGATAFHIDGERVETVSGTAHTGASATATKTVVQMAFITERESTPSTTFSGVPSGFTIGSQFHHIGSGATSVGVAYNLTPISGSIGGGTWTADVANDALLLFVVGLEVPVEASGDRTATASLTGAAAVTREASGDRATTAGLVGAAGLTRTATGNLAATATLAGAADVTEAPPVPVASAEPRSPFLIEVWDGTSTPFVKAGRIGSYTSSEVILRHNQVGSWRFTLALTDGGVNLFTAAGRRVTIDYRGTRIMSGPAFGIRRARNGNTDDVEVYGYDDLIWLNRRLAFPNPLATFPADGVGFTQPTVRDAITDDAETMIKYWVTRNCVTRLPVPGLSVATDLARGAVRTYGPRWETVLEACARIADITGLGLRITQASGALSFDVYESATQPVRLSRSLGNLRDWEFINEGPKKTRNVIGLDGEDAARRYMLSKLTSSETGWGITESFFDSSGDTDAERYEQGLDDLAVNVPTYSFTVAPRDTESMRFGETYNLGDTVTTELLPSVTLTDKVRQVTITDSVENGIDVQPVIGDLGAAERASAVYLELRRLRARINKFEREA